MTEFNKEIADKLFKEWLSAHKHIKQVEDEIIEKIAKPMRAEQMKRDEELTKWGEQRLEFLNEQR